MLIWFDPLTPKQALLFHHIGLRLTDEGHTLLYTSRKYDYTTTLFAKISEFPLHIIGEHGGGTLLGKMRASARRIHDLTEFIASLDKQPELSINFSSPDATRVAFGLGIPNIIFNDTPHAVAVGKLTVPLSKKVIIPKSIPREAFENLGAAATSIVQYDGVDEVEWLRDFEPNYEIFDELGLDPSEPFILARPEESSAAYYLSYKMTDDTVLDQLILQAIPEYTGKIVILPRYPSQAKKLRARFNNRAIIPDTGMDSRSLMIHADVVITGGGTIAREAAMLGAKSLCYFPKPLAVNDYLIKKGFPLYHSFTLKEAIEQLRELIKMEKPDPEVIKEKVKNMESPGDALLRVLREMEREA